MLKKKPGGRDGEGGEHASRPVRGTASLRMQMAAVDVVRNNRYGLNVKPTAGFLDHTHTQRLLSLGRLLARLVPGWHLETWIAGIFSLSLCLDCLYK